MLASEISLSSKGGAGKYFISKYTTHEKEEAFTHPGNYFWTQ